MFRGVFEGWHVVILLVVLVVLFGAKRLPDASRSIGRSMKIFKSEIKDLHDDDKPAVEAGSAPAEPVRTETARTDTARTEPVRTESARTEVTPSPDIRIEAPRPVTPAADRQPADHHSV